MSNDMLTLELIGEVPLDRFAAATKHLQGLIEALSEEIASDAEIEWLVEELEAGSATTTVRGISEQVEAVRSVVLAYGNVGEALEQGNPIRYSPRVQRTATALTNILDGKIIAIRLATAASEATVAGRAAEGETRAVQYALGMLRGRVETISQRKGLHFRLYDSLFDRAVICSLQEGQQDIDMLRNAWGKLVAVSGLIGRSPDTGRPVSVRRIEAIKIIEAREPGNYRRARGILNEALGDEKPEDAIREIRDAW